MASAVKSSLEISSTPVKQPVSAVKYSFVNSVAQKSLDYVRGAGHSVSRTVTVLSFTDTSLNLINRICQIVHQIFYGNSKHPLAQPIGTVVSGIGLGVGALYTVPKGAVDLYKSNQIHDGEGARRASHKIVFGSLIAVGSAFSLASSLGASLSRLPIPFLFEVALSLSVLNSGLILYRCSTYSSKINALLKDGKKEDVLSTLRFLKGKDQNREVNIQHMARRTNDAMARETYGQLDKYIKALENPRATSSDIEAAKKLITKLQAGVREKITFTFLSLISTMLALTALLMSDFFSLGIVPLILFATSSTISLGLLLYPIITWMIEGSKKPIGNGEQASNVIHSAVPEVVTDSSHHFDIPN